MAMYFPGDRDLLDKTTNWFCSQPAVFLQKWVEDKVGQCVIEGCGIKTAWPHLKWKEKADCEFRKSGSRLMCFLFPHC